MNNLVERYRSDGHPATASVLVHASVKPVVGNTITIQGVVYTFGTDFVGEEPMIVARSLVAAINADPNTDLNALPNTQPVKNYYAIFYGRLVRLIATFPGTGGNAMTLATNNAAAFIISGATFTGGTAANAVIP